jgi:serine/threonine protein kinase
MEFCEKGDLGRLLYSDQPVSAALKVRFAVDVALAVAWLHSLEPPVLHRDVRSPNVMLVSLNPQDRIVCKLGDFGSATQMSGRLTQALPTFQWMAPEVLAGRSYDLSSDVYSFGMVLHEIVFRKIPFSEFEQYFSEVRNNQEEIEYFWKEMEIREAIQNGLLPTLQGIFSPEETRLNDMMRKCWSAPADRPSAAAIAHSLTKDSKFERLMTKIPQVNYYYYCFFFFFSYFLSRLLGFDRVAAKVSDEASVHLEHSAGSAAGE